jgi:hypothetical protein
LFVTGRFSLAALYYAGVAAYGNDFATDLGKLNEEYVLEQLDQLSGVGAAVSGEIEYEKSTFSTDGFVVLPDQVLLVEVKSRRPALDKRLDAVSYTNLLGKDVRHAQDQLRTTYDLWRCGHPAFAHLPTDARPVRGLIVVPEPLYLANHHVRAGPEADAVSHRGHLVHRTGATRRRRCRTVRTRVRRSHHRVVVSVRRRVCGAVRRPRPHGHPRTPKRPARRLVRGDALDRRRHNVSRF